VTIRNRTITAHTRGKTSWAGKGVRKNELSRKVGWGGEGRKKQGNNTRKKENAGKNKGSWAHQKERTGGKISFGRATREKKKAKREKKKNKQ